MTARTSFLAELKRRNVIRVAIAYVAVSWRRFGGSRRAGHEALSPSPSRNTKLTSIASS